jgi:polysaccharide biosynthesis transport protein
LENRTASETTIFDLIANLYRRRILILKVTLTVTVLAGLYCASATRRYQSTGTLVVQPDTYGDLGLGGLLTASGGSTAPPASVDLDVTLQTQSGILESDNLAIRTIEALKLEDNEDFKPGFLTKIFEFGIPDDPPGASLQDAPKRRRRELLTFEKRLDVESVVGTRLLTVSFINKDPKTAAAVVNTLMRELVNYNFQMRFDATSEASQWLRGQLGDLRKQTDSLEARVAELKRQSGVYSIGATNAQGQEQPYAEVISRLQQSTAALNASTQNRILKGAIAKAADAGDAELLSGLAGNTPGGQLSTSLSEIQALREQESTAKAALEQAEAKFGPGWPKLAELRASLAATQQSIQAEVGRLRARADNDYDNAVKEENDSRQRYQEDKGKADELNNKAVEYSIVSQEAEQSRQFYEQLLQRLQEAGLIKGFNASNINIVDKGLVTAKPFKPKVPLLMAVAIFGGFSLGVLGAFVLNLFDRKIYTIADVEDLLAQNVLGATPLLRQKSMSSQNSLAAMVRREPQSSFAEGMRAIRSSVLLARGENPPKVILVTSSIAREGKTVFAANLATALSLNVQRVLLVDTDLRSGKLAHQLGLDRGPGLTELLTGRFAEPPIAAYTANLNVLQSGLAVPPNPSELLSSASMKHWLDRWRKEYDFIVLDGAPVLPVTDSVILTTVSDMTILLARSGLTSRPQLERSYAALAQSSNHHIALVLNGMDPGDPSYNGYYGYDGYRSNVSAEEEVSSVR